MNNVKYQLPVSEETMASSARVIKGLVNGTYQEQFLTNAAKPFSEKQCAYLSAYKRSLRSRNYGYLLEIRGEYE